MTGIFFSILNRIPDLHETDLRGQLDLLHLVYVSSWSDSFQPKSAVPDCLLYGHLHCTSTFLNIVFRVHYLELLKHILHEGRKRSVAIQPSGNQFPGLDVTADRREYRGGSPNAVQAC